MKRIIAAILSALLCMGLLAGVSLAERPTAVAHKVCQPLTIDGDLNDWDLSSPIEINTVDQVIRDGNVWIGPQDCSCIVYVMWDEVNLYLAVDVTEDSPFGAADMLPLDKEDNFKLFLSTDPTANPDRQTFESNDFLVYFLIDNNFWDTAIDRSMVPKEYRKHFKSKGVDGGENALPDMEKAIQKTTTGFIYEAAIPFASFSNDDIPVYTPAVGDTVGFDFVITDIAYPCPGTEYVPQLAWTGDLNININPSLWGLLAFE